MIAKAGSFRGWLLLGGASPYSSKRYVGRYKLTSPSQSIGDRQYSPAALTATYGAFNREVFAQLPPEDAVFTLEGYVKTGGRMPFSEILEEGRRFDYQALIGTCSNPSVYGNWDKILVFEGCLVNSVAYEGTGALSKAEDSATLHRVSVKAKDMYEVRRMSYSNPTQVEELTDIVFAKSNNVDAPYLAWNALENKIVESNQDTGETAVCYFDSLDSEDIGAVFNLGEVVAAQEVSQSNRTHEIYLTGVDPLANCSRVRVLGKIAKVIFKEYDGETDRTKYRIQFLEQFDFSSSDILCNRVDCNIDCTGYSFDPVWVNNISGGKPDSFELVFDLTTYDSNDFLLNYAVNVTLTSGEVLLDVSNISGSDIQTIFTYNYDHALAGPFIGTVTITMESALGCIETVTCSTVDLAVQDSFRGCVSTPACDFFDADILWVLSEFTITTLTIEEIFVNWGTLVDYTINIYDNGMVLLQTVTDTVIPKTHNFGSVPTAVDHKVEFVITNDRGCSYTLLCDPVDTNSAFTAINCDVALSPCLTNNLVLRYTYNAVTGELIFQNPNVNVAIFRVSASTAVGATPYHNIIRNNPRWPLSVPPDAGVPLSGTGTGTFTAITYDGCYYVLNCTGIDFASTYTGRGCTEIYECTLFTANFEYNINRTGSGIAFGLRDVTLNDSDTEEIDSVRVTAYAGTGTDRIYYFNDLDALGNGGLVYLGPVLNELGTLELTVTTANGCVDTLTCSSFDFNLSAVYNDCVPT